VFELDLLIEGIEHYNEPLLQLLRFNGSAYAHCHSKTKITPQSYYKFAWEMEKGNIDKNDSINLSHDEIMKRAEEFKQEIGNLKEK
jgi:hypothetical protein